MILSLTTETDCSLSLEVTWRRFLSSSRRVWAGVNDRKKWTGRSGWRVGHKEDGVSLWFSWINSTWQRWRLQTASGKLCTAAVCEAADLFSSTSPAVPPFIWCVFQFLFFFVLHPTSLPHWVPSSLFFYVLTTLFPQLQHPLYVNVAPLFIQTLPFQSLVFVCWRLEDAL